VSRGGARRDGSCAGSNHVFEGADGGGADGDDAACILQSPIDGGGGAGGDGIGLRVEFVIFDSIDADGLKRPQAHVQGDGDGLDATLADAVEDFKLHSEPYSIS